MCPFVCWIASHVGETSLYYISSAVCGEAVGVLCWCPVQYCPASNQARCWNSRARGRVDKADVCPRPAAAGKNIVIIFNEYSRLEETPPISKVYLSHSCLALVLSVSCNMGEKSAMYGVFLSPGHSKKNHPRVNFNWKITIYALLTRNAFWNICALLTRNAILHNTVERVFFAPVIFSRFSRFR